MRDSFQTISYKNVYIQLCYDRNLKKFVVEFNINNKSFLFHNLDYAKYIIRKELRKNSGYKYKLRRWNIEGFVEKDALFKDEILAAEAFNADRNKYPDNTLILSDYLTYKTILIHKQEQTQ